MCRGPYQKNRNFIPHYSVSSGDTSIALTLSQCPEKRFGKPTRLKVVFAGGAQIPPSPLTGLCQRILAAFSLDFGNVLTRPGNPPFCAVATFQPPRRFEIPSSGPRRVDFPVLSDTSRAEKVIVLKRKLESTGPKQRTRPVNREIAILRQIHKLRQIYMGSKKVQDQRYCYLPQLNFHSLDFQEPGILPYGAAIDPGHSIFKWPGIHKVVPAALSVRTIIKLSIVMFDKIMSFIPTTTGFS